MALTNTERFWNRVTTSDGCWLWNGQKTHNGYGTASLAGTTQMAHRIAYQLLVGPIPEGLTLDHLCKTKLCVRPEHLEPVTLRENILRGDCPTAKNARKTECFRGHPLVGDNVMVDKRRGRTCRTCKNDYNRKNRSKVHEYYSRKLAEKDRRISLAREALEDTLGKCGWNACSRDERCDNCKVVQKALEDTKP